jgi:hypothetical protein
LKGLITAKIVVLGVLKGGAWAKWGSTKRACSCKKRSKTFKNSTETFKNHTEIFKNSTETFKNIQRFFTYMRI